MTDVQVVRGVPESRPEGFPCFGCGAQVTVERGVKVDWPDGRTTMELICAACAPLYGLGEGVNAVEMTAKDGEAAATAESPPAPSPEQSRGSRNCDSPLSSGEQARPETDATPPSMTGP